MTWRTIVTDLVALPFEHIDSALEELRRRWGISPLWNGAAIAPGMLVAWRARPVAYLGVPTPDGTDLPALACAHCAPPALREWIIEHGSNDGRSDPA